MTLHIEGYWIANGKSTHGKPIKADKIVKDKHELEAYRKELSLLNSEQSVLFIYKEI
jgi:hypothetical protein